MQWADFFILFPDIYKEFDFSLCGNGLFKPIKDEDLSDSCVGKAFFILRLDK